MDTARREVLEAQSGALKQPTERFIGLQSRRDCPGSLVSDYTGDIDELQAGLAGERCQRRCDRLRGDGGAECRRFMRLGQRWGSKERNGRADRGRAQHPRHHGRYIR